MATRLQHFYNFEYRTSFTTYCRSDSVTKRCEIGKEDSCTGHWITVNNHASVLAKTPDSAREQLKGIYRPEVELEFGEIKRSNWRGGRYSHRPCAEPLIRHDYHKSKAS